MTQSSRTGLLAVLGVFSGLLALLLRRHRTAQSDVQTWHDATTSH